MKWFLSGRYRSLRCTKIFIPINNLTLPTRKSKGNSRVKRDIIKAINMNNSLVNDNKNKQQ